MQQRKPTAILISTLVLALVLLSGCSKESGSSGSTTGDKSSSSKIPREFQSAVTELHEEEGITVTNPVHTVDYGDHTVIFFLEKNDDAPDNPLLVSLSFCKDNTGEYNNGDYYVGAFEVDDVKTCTSYRGDIPATFISDPNYDYGCCWIAGPKNLLDEYYADRVDKEIKIDDTYSVYIDEDENGGQDVPTMKNIWAYYKEQGIIAEDSI